VQTSRKGMGIQTADANAPIEPQAAVLREYGGFFTYNQPLAKLSPTKRTTVTQ